MRSRLSGKPSFTKEIDRQTDRRTDERWTSVCLYGLVIKQKIPLFFTSFQCGCNLRSKLSYFHFAGTPRLPGGPKDIQTTISKFKISLLVISLHCGCYLCPKRWNFYYGDRCSICLLFMYI